MTPTSRYNDNNNLFKSVRGHNSVNIYLLIIFSRVNVEKHIV